jgi:ABC-type transporter Mla subunit MlaD
MARVVARNNVLAGSFLLVALAMAVGVSFALGGRGGLGETTPYTVRFKLRSGASGLKPGSDVRLGGQLVGKVTSVAFARETVAGSNEEVVGIDIGVKVRKDIELYPDAGVTLEQPLLGSLTTINIWSIGDPRLGLLKPGTMIAGGLAPPGIISQLGLNAEDIQSIPKILSDARAIVETWRKTSDEAAPKVSQTVDTIQGSVDKVGKRVDSYLASGDRVAASAEQFAGRLSPWMDQADDAVAGAKTFVGKLEAVVDENREPIRLAVDNANALVMSLRQDSLARLNASLDSAKSSMEQVNALAADARGLVGEEGPNIQKLLANARLASDQLKLTMTEIRAQPWRLFQRPSTKELERELLYDSARAYVWAASDLRATADAIGALDARSQRAPLSDLKGDLTALQAKLNESFARFQKTEQDFLGRLIKQQDEPGDEQQPTPATGGKK